MIIMVALRFLICFSHRQMFNLKMEVNWNRVSRFYKYALMFAGKNRDVQNGRGHRSREWDKLRG